MIIRVIRYGKFIIVWVINQVRETQALEFFFIFSILLSRDNSTASSIKSKMETTPTYNTLKDFDWSSRVKIYLLHID